MRLGLKVGQSREDFDSSAQISGKLTKSTDQSTPQPTFIQPTAAPGKAWKDVWSAGHGVLNIHDTLSTKELVDRLEVEYLKAVQDEKERLTQWVPGARL